jgi:hypothetical protein
LPRRHFATSAREARHDPGPVSSEFHDRSRRHQPDGNCKRYSGVDRYVWLAPTARLDRILSAHDNAHQPYRVFVSDPRFYAGARNRNRLVRAAGVGAFALYGKRLAGAWRWIYVATASSALYLNVLVLIVQSFQKLPFLKPLAPTQSEPPFLIAQVIALIVFLLAGIAAALKFRPAKDLPTG